MSTKDFNAQFERVKDFKSKHPDLTEEDEYFKAMYARFRKHVKKINKIDETQDKIQKKGVAPTPEQKEMLGKRSELRAILKEVSSIIDEYIKNYDKHCEQIYAFKSKQHKQSAQQEEVKHEVRQEPEEVHVEESKPVSQEPQIDVEAIRKEEYDRGYDEGRNDGYDEGRKEAYEQGKTDGYSQSRREFEATVKEQPSIDYLEKAANYSSLYSVMGCWIDNLMPMEPQFKRSDYFTEEECFAIKQLYYFNQMMHSPMNFKRMVDASSDRTKKLVNKVNEFIPNCQNVTYKQLAESFDRVLENSKFANTNHQLYTATQDFMMGFGGYGSMPGMMPGQMLGQMPGMMPTHMSSQMHTSMPIDMQMSLQNKIGGNVQVFDEEQPLKSQYPHREPEPEEEREQEPADEENTPTYHVAATEEPSQASSQHYERDLEKAGPTGTGVDIWNEDDDEDDDEGEDHESDTKSNEEPEQPVAAPGQVSGEQPLGEGQDDLEQKEGRKYGDRPYRGRGGRGYNRGYVNRGYGNRGYNRGYQGGENYRGGESYRGTESYRGGEGYRGGRPYNKWQGQSRGQRRGGGRYRDDRDNRGYWNQPYEEEKQEPQVETKDEEDDFFVVKEKVYKEKPRRKKAAPKKPEVPKEKLE